MEIAALILGIIGFILAWIPACGMILGGIPALIAFILAIVALVKKMPKRKQAIAGLVLSILAFIAMIVSLVIIPIIGTGLYTFNSATSVLDKASELSSQEVKIYNETFEIYKGEEISGSRVMSLCDDVRNHNLASDISKQIQMIEGTATNKSASSFTSSQASSVGNLKKNIRSVKKYTVTMGYDPETGFITQIGVKEYESDIL